MGIYLNPGNENFIEFLSAEIYVDKSLMIRELNRFMDAGNKYVCISRPRRFGKTIAGNMISSYYSKGCDSRGLFRDLKISGDEGFEEKLNKYNVIKIDMNSEYQNTIDREKLIKRLTGKIRKELGERYKDMAFSEEDSLADCIMNVYSDKGESFVIILDEYDVLVREKVPQELFNEYLRFLNGLFKSDTLRPAISLAYLTGILPVVRDKIQSKLNNFEEYTILDSGELTEYVGFTTDEVRYLCDKYGMDFEECRRWYDGYHLGGMDIYNPESVVKSMLKKDFGNYWGKTSSYQAISDQIERDFKGTNEDVVRMLSGELVPVDADHYLNTMTDFKTKDDVFTYLIHIGYLAYDKSRESARIPNREIRREWERAVSAMEDYSMTDKIIKDSRELLQETLKGNEGHVAEALDQSHIHVTSNRSYNNEDALQSAICLAYIYALNKYTIVREMTAGKGFADVVFIPVEKNDPAMIIELKRNDSPESAVQQIREKKYFDSLKHYQGKLLFVGINYDEKDKTHECRIEKFMV